MPALLNPVEAEFWVGVGLLIFLAVVAWKGRGALFATLDAKAVQVRGNLDEAARLRAEAEALLASLQAERAVAERQASEMLANAQADARRMESEANARLEEQIARRQQMAERKIANAETQALAEVKAAAAEMAAQAAERILATRLAEGRADPFLDRGIAQLATRLG